MLFSDINISQGSVAKHLRYGGIFHDHLIANFFCNATLSNECWQEAQLLLSQPIVLYAALRSS